MEHNKDVSLLEFMVKEKMYQVYALAKNLRATLSLVNKNLNRITTIFTKNESYMVLKINQYNFKDVNEMLDIFVAHYKSITDIRRWKIYVNIIDDNESECVEFKDYALLKTRKRKYDVMNNTPHKPYLIHINLSALSSKTVEINIVQDRNVQLTVQFPVNLGHFRQHAPGYCNLFESFRIMNNFTKTFTNIALIDQNTLSNITSLIVDSFLIRNIHMFPSLTIFKCQRLLLHSLADWKITKMMGTLFENFIIPTFVRKFIVRNAVVEEYYTGIYLDFSKCRLDKLKFSINYISNLPEYSLQRPAQYILPVYMGQTNGRDMELNGSISRIEKNMIQISFISNSNELLQFHYSLLYVKKLHIRGNIYIDTNTLPPNLEDLFVASNTPETKSTNKISTIDLNFLPCNITRFSIAMNNAYIMSGDYNLTKYKKLRHFYLVCGQIENNVVITTDKYCGLFQIDQPSESEIKFGLILKNNRNIICNHSEMKNDCFTKIMHASDTEPIFYTHFHGVCEGIYGKSILRILNV